MSKSKATKAKKPEKSAKPQTASAAPKAAAPPSDPKEIKLTDDGIRSKERRVAELATEGTVLSSILLMHFGGVGTETNINELRKAVAEQAGAVNSGDLKQLEAMLTAQAIALDAMFGDFAIRAHKNAGQYMDATMKYMNVALKAQSQCRTTVEALAEIKNPRPYALHQHNRAEYQQVNNGAQPPRGGFKNNTRPHTQAETPERTSKLLEADNGEWLDGRATSATGYDDSQVETVGAIDRPAHG